MPAPLVLSVQREKFGNCVGVYCMLGRTTSTHIVSCRPRDTCVVCALLKLLISKAIQGSEMLAGYIHSERDNDYLGMESLCTPKKGDNCSYIPRLCDLLTILIFELALVQY